MDRPVIGLCTALERARWSVWDQQAFLLPRSYIDAVQRAGGLAIMLPPDERAMDDPDAVLDLVDGLILAGGADIDPDAYGEERHRSTVGTVPERDTFAQCRTLDVNGAARGRLGARHRQGREFARGDHLGQDHRRGLQRLDFFFRISAPRPVLHHQHA